MANSPLPSSLHLLPSSLPLPLTPFPSSSPPPSLLLLLLSSPPPSSYSPLLSPPSPILPSHQLLIGYEHNYLELWDALSWKPLSIFGPMKVIGAYENSCNDIILLLWFLCLRPISVVVNGLLSPSLPSLSFLPPPSSLLPPLSLLPPSLPPSLLTTPTEG